MLQQNCKASQVSQSTEGMVKHRNLHFVEWALHYSRLFGFRLIHFLKEKALIQKGVSNLVPLLEHQDKQLETSNA